MGTVGVNAIDTAALGRPFQLGMLYDCRKDALVPGITLWDKEQLQQSIREHPQINTDFNVIASDSIAEKSHLLNIDGCLKLSLLCGLVNVSGAAKYLSDTKKSFKQQRLTLHYRSTTRFEELTMNHLASGNIAHYEVFDNDTATHVVTAVLYGANACFVFDREVSLDEDKSTIEGEVKAAFGKLKGISVGAEIDLNLNDNQKAAVQKFSCTFYGDFQLPSNPVSFEDALRVFADLPKLLGEKKEFAVPLRVWLYPLDKLHSRAPKLQKDISIGLIKHVESVFESLSTTEMKCSDLLRDTPSLAFAGFCDKITQMKQNCCNYKLCLMKKLGFLLPKIRGDLEKEAALIDLLRDQEECPFRGCDLEKWVKERENESAIMKTLLRQLIEYGATVEENVDEILMDLKVENIVSYTFTSFEWPDELLSKQNAFLSPAKKDNGTFDSKHKTGFTSEIKRTMRSNLDIFKNLIESKTRKPAKFIVSSKEMKNNPGSCILLYENGSDEASCFTPPLKPASPVTEQICEDRVVLKVNPACSATEKLRLMYKMKEEKDWRSQPVLQGHDTVTLTDLQPNTGYEMKYTALGKLNYTIDSDVISVTTDPEVKKPNASENKLQKISIRLKESLSENKRLKEENAKLHEEIKYLKDIEGDIKMYSVVTGETDDSHMQFTGILRSCILNLREISEPDKSDVIVVFCPIVSQSETNLEEEALNALKTYNYHKLTVLVVLHKKSDTDKTVPDCSRCVKERDTLTVDCLYNENEGLLNFPGIIDATDKIVNWLQQQGKKISKCPFQNAAQMQHQLRERSHSSSKLGGESNTKKQKMDHDFNMTKKEMVKVYSILAGNTNKAHEEFINNLTNLFENLRVSTTAEQSHIIIVHCPIVSRAGTDIDAALKKFTEITDSQLGVLVVYHDTFDPEKTVPDSSRCVSMKNLLTVDCLFCKDTGLLKCQRNSDALDKVVKWLKEQTQTRAVKLLPRHNKIPENTASKIFKQLRGLGRSVDNV